MDLIIKSFLENVPSVGILLVIALSIYILGKGADFLVDQAIILSIIWKIPAVIIGATVVSLGTTIPEVTVSVMASLNGNTDLALGNAVGSIITNTTLILGLVAYMGTIKVNRQTMKKQGGLLIGLSIFLTLVALPRFNNGTNGLISNKVGYLLLGLLVAYIFISIKSSQGDNSSIEKDIKSSSIILQLVKLVVGILVVVASSKLLIPAVEIGAARLGIPNSIIAATLVAFGTSVPELTTAIMSVKKGYGDLALGNILGANILNILFVTGLSAVVAQGGLVVPGLYVRLQMPMMILSVSVLYGLAMNKTGKLERKSGLTLLATYIIYLILNYFLA